jgi:large subunit ribosomal protein L20
MAKVKHSVATRRRKHRLLKKTKGYFGDRSKQFQQARRALAKAMVYAYRDRKNFKREIRALWIIRINAACREHGITYSAFMKGLKNAKVEIDRKMLSQMAIDSPKVFKKLVELVRA